MTPVGEKDAWLNIVQPQDLDTHLAGIGQAQANAEIVREMFSRYPLEEGSKLLIHGCGTCQLFDYLNPPEIGNVHITLADISQKMLHSAKERLAKHEGLRYELIEDDLENTTLQGRYDAALLILVLLHVDWRKSLDNLIRLGPTSLYIIEQEQDSQKPSVTKERELPPSIQKYAETVDAELVPIKALTEFLGHKGYLLAHSTRIEVPDDKLMVGLIYTKA